MATWIEDDEMMFVEYAPKSALELLAMVDAYRDMAAEGLFDDKDS